MKRFIRSLFLVFFSNINHGTCNESIWKGFGTIASQNRRHFGKGLRISLPWHFRGTWVRAASLPSWKFFARQVTPRMKTISSFFDALPSRKCPAIQPRILRQIYSVRKRTRHAAWRKKGVRSTLKKFSTELEENISMAAIYWRKKCTVQLVWTQTKGLGD